MRGADLKILIPFKFSLVSSRKKSLERILTPINNGEERAKGVPLQEDLY
jgi:hypothetical protein